MVFTKMNILTFDIIIKAQTRADSALTHGPTNPTSPEFRCHPEKTGGPMTMALPYRQKAMVKTRYMYHVALVGNCDINVTY